MWKRNEEDLTNMHPVIDRKTIFIGVMLLTYYVKHCCLSIMEYLLKA